MRIKTLFSSWPHSPSYKFTPSLTVSELIMGVISTSFAFFKISLNRSKRIISFQTLHVVLFTSFNHSIYSPIQGVQKLILKTSPSPAWVAGVATTV